jgi:hypothetical protein
MESLKERNKKHARRFGMRKKSFVGLALGTVGLMGLIYDYSNVQAGSFTNSTGGAFPIQKVAKELVDGNATFVSINFDNGTNRYTPRDIPLGSLDGPTINVSVDNGKIYVGAGGVAICNSTNNGTIAQLQTGNSTRELVFGGLTTTVANGIGYYIGNQTCNGTANLTFEIPKGASSVTLTIRLGSATTQTIYDTASATIISAVPQFSAEVSRRFDAMIDYETEFKNFGSNTTITNATIRLNSEHTNLNVNVGGYSGYGSTNATFSVTLKPTDMSGISTVTIIPRGVSPVPCTKLTDRFVCNATNNVNDIETNFVGHSDSYTINATVNGTEVLSERRFTVDALLDFARSEIADKTLLTNADFGQWIYRGTTIYVPLIGVNPSTGRETYIKLQSKDTNPNTNKVRAIILASDGSTVAADLGQITTGQPFTITGSDLAARVQAAGKTVGDSFAAVLIVTTAEENLFGYANIVDSSGAKRVPLKVRTGNIVE